MGFQFDWGWDFNWLPFTGGDLSLLTFMLVLNIGAAFRLSRLLARDTILDRPRTAAQAKYHGMLIDLWLCMWCLGFWFALIGVFLTAWQTTHDLWLIIATVLTVSTAVGYMSERA
jgi:hypothetical protein